MVGVVTVLAGWRFAAVLIWFFLSSSLITKVGTRRKLAVEDGHAVGGQRTAIQVIANGLAGTVAAAATAVLLNVDAPTGTATDEALLTCPSVRAAWWPTTLLAAFVAHYACCCGDTWASELGVLTTAKPVLVTTWKQVKHSHDTGEHPIGSAPDNAPVPVVCTRPTGPDGNERGDLAARDGRERPGRRYHRRRSVPREPAAIGRGAAGVRQPRAPRHARARRWRRRLPGRRAIPARQATREPREKN